MHLKYDIFISYRREGGSETARLLKSELEKRGYRIFLDVADLVSGHYDEALLKNIEASHAFLVILTPGAMDRCSNPEDWLRTEIAHALKLKRSIIPVLMPGFAFPELPTLPEDLRDLPLHQAIGYDHSLFDAMMDKLCGYIGRPRCGSIWKRMGKGATISLATSVILVAIVATFVVWKHEGVAPTIPATISTQDVNLLKSLADDMCGQMTQINNVLGEVSDLGRRASRLMDSANPDPAKLNELANECRFTSAQIERAIKPPMWQGGHQDDLNRLDVPAEDVYAFYSIGIPSFWEDLKKYFNDLALRLDMPPRARLGSEGRQMELDTECVRLEAELMHYGLLGLLSHFPKESVADFGKFSSQWTQLADANIMPQPDADNMSEKTLKRINDILVETSTLVGNGEVALHDAENKLNDLMPAEARRTLMSNPKVAEMQGRVDQREAEVDARRQDLADVKNRLAAAKAELLEQCRIKDDDTLYVMWQKILKLHKVNLNAQADEQITRMLVLQGAKEPGLDTCVRAARAFWAHQTEYNGAGVLLMFFENNAPHSFLKRGDIILSMNGKALASEEDFVHAPRIENGANVVEFIRLNPNGIFERHKETGNKSNPRIAIVELFDTQKARAAK